MFLWLPADTIIRRPILMVPSQTSKVKRLRESGDGMLLDKKRLKSIRRKIADGYYDREEVSQSIVERLADQLSVENSDTEP